MYIINCGVLDDALSVLEEGLRNRTTASHNLNDHSSRSHSVLTVYCESESFPEGAEVPVKKFGKVSFIDLAGSERVKLSKATGETFNEMLKINQSLLNLSKCISTLSDHRKHTHVPFRDSKLTMLLQDSLMGNGQALMIACVSPLLANMHETIKTLRYAQQASHIPSRPVLNVDPRIEAFLRMKQEINDLRKENLELRTLLEKEDVDEPNGSIADDLVNNQNSVSLPTLLYQSDQIEDSPVELRRLAYSQDNILGSLEAQERLLDMHRRRSETKREQQREQAGSRTSVKSNSSRIRRSPSIPFEDRPQWIDASSRKNPLPNRRIKSQDISPAKQRIESLHKSAVAAKDAYMLDANRISTPYPYSSLSKKQEANTVPKAKTNHGNIKYTITKNRIYPKKNVIPPIQRLTTGVTRAVKNRHNDMQDVHALDAEIKRMSFI